MKVFLKHPLSDRVIKEVNTDGFNWGAFLLGPLWYCGYGLWGKGIMYFLGSLFGSLLTFGVVGVILWFVMGFKFNSEYYESLLKEGYKEKK